MILIVDDKAENIFSLKRTLELHGFRADSAGSGEEALRKILKNTYSLIILDVQMPGMDGFEVAEALSGYSKAREIPIIFLSAVNTDKKFIARGYTSGGVDYVTKPVDPDIFMLKVKTLHRLCQQNRELNRIRLSLLEEVDTRKRAEDESNRRLQELHFTLEAMPQIAFTLKADGQIEYVNEHWYLYSNHPDQLPEFHPDDRQYLDEWNRAISNGDPLSCEVRILNIMTRDYRFHLLKMIPVRQGGAVERWVGTFTDIQEQMSAHELLDAKVKERTLELLEKNRELEARNHELQQFAFVASHDLKEPLRKIQIFSSIMKDRFLNGTEEAHQNVDRIIEAAGRMSGLIHDLLNYSRLSTDTLFQQTDLEEVVRGIVSDLDLTIREKDALVDVGPMPVIDAIPGQMRQVFQNLISNSLKFSRPGIRPEISITAELVGHPDPNSPSVYNGDYCRIVVKDNGIGFHEQYLTKIFTIFQRLNAKEAYEGNGIGLAIVKKIVEKHNGIITARSAESRGASFIMILPLQQNGTYAEVLPRIL